jgi:hypothetical protein
MAGVYSVTVTSAQGCSATATANVVVNLLPTPTVTGTTVCVGGTITLNASGGTNYNWNGPNGFTATGATISRTSAIATMAGVYTLTVTNVNGCATTTTAAVAVNNLPTPTASGSTVCVGSTVNLTSSGGSSYLWAGPNSFTSTAQNPNIANATTAMGGVYTVSAYQINGTATNIIRNITGFNSANFSFINSTSSYGGPQSLFNAIDDDSGNSFHASMVTSGQTYGISYNLGSEYYISNLSIDARNDCCTERGKGGMMQVYNQGVLVYQSNTLTGSGNGVISATPAPNVVGDQVRYVFLNGAATSSGEFLINFNEWNIEGNHICKATATANVVVNIIPPAPTSAGAARCGTGTVALTATGCAGGTISWFSSATGGVALTTGANYTTPSIATSTNYFVECTLSGCTSTTRNTVTATINPIPTASATGDTECVGSTIALTSNGGNNYAWSGPNGFNSTVQNPNITNASTAMAGVYSVTVTSAQGCSATATANVVVNTIPPAPTSAGAARCGTGTVALTATGCAGGTISWFSSATGGVALTTGANYTTPSISTSTNYFVECTLSGCTSTTRNTVTATINAIPTASATGDTECVGSTIALTSNGGNNYAWSGPNGFNSTVQNPNITNASTAMAGVYSVTVTSAQGCSATATANVVVNIIPAAPTSAGAARCGTGTVALTATGCAGGTISWFSSATGGVALTTGANYITPSISTSTNYFVECTLSGCTSTTRNTVTATINAIPTASASSNTPVTAGSTINLTSTGGGTYSWTSPNNFTSTLQNPNISNIDGLNVGIYTVTVTGAGGCSATATTEVLIKYTDPGAVDCANIPTLNFSSPTLISGTAGAVGAQYRFTNVTTGTDAIVTIQSKSHSDIDILTLDEPAATYGGLDAAMQPIIDYNWINGGGSFDAAGEKSVTFKIDFVNTGTLTPKNIPVVTMTGVDIDGSGVTNEVREFIQTSNYQSYETQNPTSLALSGTTKAKGGYASYYGINDAIQDAMISFFYPNVNSITVTYGAEWGGATGDFVDFGLPNSDERRLNSLSFKCYDLPNIVCQPVIAPTVTNNSRCGNGAVTLSASGCTGGTISWYSGLTGGTALATGSTYTTPTLLTTTNYYVECLLVGCTSSPRTMVTATINAIPTASATGGTFCENATISLAASGGNTYSWVGPNGYTAAGASISRGPATLTMAGTYTVTITSTAGCTATTAVSVTINTLPNSPTVANMQRCAAGTVTLTASGCSGGNISWFDSQTGTTALNVGINFVTPNLSESRFYFASCSSNNCVSPTRTTVQVTINSLPVAEATGINSTCMSNVAANNGKLVLSKFLSTDQYSYNLGSTYNSSTATALATIPVNGEILTGITNPATSQTYNIRIVNAAGCLIDRNVTISKSCDACPPNYCEKPTVTKQ